MLLSTYMKANLATTDQFDIIKTSLPSLDSILGTGGIASKKITEISGIWSVGKSTLALQIIASAQREKRPCLFCDSEFSFSSTYATTLDVDCDKLDLEQKQYAEETLDALEEWATKNKNGLIVLDSIGALLPQEEAEKGSAGRSIGLQARLIGSFTRRIVPILSLKNHALIVLYRVYMIYLKPCGHRIADEHFTKIRKLARKWKVGEAEALRLIIEKAK